VEAPASPLLTFVVRVDAGPAGRLTGTVERVRTGARHPFDGPGALAHIIQRVVEAERRASPPAAARPRARAR
jgi:hypothetical protein